MPQAEELIGSRLTLARCCRCLRIDPPLRPDETVSWIHRNPDTGIGINAAVYCFDPAHDDEPYVLSVGAYEEMRVNSPAGQDYGTDRAVIADLDFALDPPESENPQSLDDPSSVRLKLVRANLGAGLADDDDRSLAEVLTELGRILAGWPAQRE